tara:strand:- start:81 stop:689 length:609 start_codon:yes stop_codon:yes gene_type:complete
MKKIVFLLIILFNTLSYSQDILQTIGKETCECLDAKKLEYSKLSKLELQTEIGMCMIQSYSTHSSEFGPEEKISFESKDGMRELGEKVAMKMMSNCPETIILMGKRSLEEEGTAEPEKENSFIEGEVTDIKTDQFISLLVKDKNGRNYNFLLLDYFDTSSLITNNEINKKDFIKVTYIESELFDPKNKEFRYFKIITDLEKK